MARPGASAHSSAFATGAVAAALAASATAAGGLAGCAQDVGLIDRTQPGLLLKSVFEGEWFLRRTVVDAPYDTGFTFIGEQDEVNRIRFEVQEHHLVAWRVLPLVEGTDDAAPIAVFAIEEHVDVQRDYNPSTGEQLNVKVENTEDRPWYDRKYVRVDWSKNLVTNFSFVVEMLEQDPVAYFVEDDHEDRVLVGRRSEDGTWQDEQDPFALQEIEDAQYLDVVTRVFVTPEEVGWEDWYGDVYYEPACWYYGNYDCAAATITVRNSFLRADAALSDYEPLDYPDNFIARDEAGEPIRVAWTADGDKARVETAEGGSGRAGSGGAAPGSAPVTDPYADGDSSIVRVPMFDKFGYFRTERFGYDPLYGEVESDRIFLINRWNVWAKSHDDSGAPIPYAEREVRPIVYYLSPGVPAHLAAAAQTSVDEWNDAFKKTVATLQGKAPSEVPDVFVLKPNSRQVDPGTGEVLVRGEVNGDLRYSHLWNVDRPTRVGLLGYGPSAADPVTGEIFSADAYVYGAAVTDFSARGRDIIDLLNGRISPEELSLGEHVKSYLAILKSGGAKAKPRSKDEYRALGEAHRSAPAPASGSGKAPGSSKGAKSKPKGPPSKEAALLKKGIEKIKRPAGWASARLETARDTSIEELLMGDPMIVGMKTGGLVDPSTPLASLPPALRERVSPLSWASPEHRKASLARIRGFAERNMTMAAFFDDAVAGLALEMKDTTPEDVIETLEAAIFRSTAEHEIGHTLGLRHNFEASSDALNYHPEYWDLAGDDPEPLAPMTEAQKKGKMRQLQYSSIMDYAGRFNTDISGIGPYDRAAIAFGYGQLVEVFEEEPDEPLVQLWEYDGGVYDRDFTLEEVLRTWRHHTSIPKMFSSREAIHQRRLVPYSKETAALMGEDPEAALLAQETGDAPWIDWEVPYRFCSDEYTEGTPTCNMFDLGADAWEIVQDVVDRYRNYYWFNNFKRDQVFFDEYDYMDSIWWRYLAFVKTIHDHWVFGQWFEADTWEFIREYYDVEDAPWEQAVDGGLALTAGSMDGMALLEEILAIPAPGAYVYDQAEGYWWSFDAGGAPLCDEGDDAFTADYYCADANLGLGPARHFESVYDYESGYYFYERLKWIGSFYDKILALEALTSPDTYFLGIDTAGNIDQWAISMNVSFPKQVQRIFGGIAADRFDLFGGTIDAKGGYQAPDVFAEAATEFGDPENAPVDPQTSFTVQLYALWYGMAWLNANYDNTFNDFAKIWLEGSGEAFTPANPDPDAVVVFTDPMNSRTYLAVRPPDDTIVGTGATMLDEANRLLQIWTDYQDDPDFDPGTDGYYKWRVQNIVENIEVVRGLYDLYGYLYF